MEENKLPSIKFLADFLLDPLESIFIRHIYSKRAAKMTENCAFRYDLSRDQLDGSKRSFFDRDISLDFSMLHLDPEATANFSTI